MPTPIIANYAFREVQGTGTFGRVYRAVWDQSLECAVKIFNKPTINEAYVSWCLEKLRGEAIPPQIISVLGFDLSQTPAYAASAWVEPPANGIRSLEDAAGKWSFPETGTALVALAEALAWLHSKGVIHTGITSRNVLMLNEHPGSICVTDVGQGLIDANQQADWSEHAPFLSPERCRYEPPQGESSGEAWDVYSFGMVAFHLLTGRKHARALEYFKKLTKQRPAAQGDKGLNLGELAKALEEENGIAWRSKVNSDQEATLRTLVERCLALALEKRYSHMLDVLTDLKKIDFEHLQPAVQTAPATVPVKSVRAQRKGAAQAKPQPKRKAVAMPELGTLKEVATTNGRQEAPAPLVETDSLESRANKQEALDGPLPDAQEGPAKVRKLNLGKLPQGQGLVIGAGVAAVLMASMAGWQYRQRNQAQREVSAMQATLVETQQKGLEQAKEMAGQAELAKQAIAEQQRLRQNLQQEQEIADQLLETLLEQKPKDDRDAEIWRARLTDYAAQVSDRLKRMGQDQSLKESSARTRWNMAGIAFALGENQAAAGWLEEALHEVEAALAATTNKERRAEWDLLGGKIQTRRGELSLNRGQSAEAMQQLGQAVQGLQAYMAALPEDYVGMRELARATWLLGRAQLAKPDPTAAVESMNLASETATKLILSPAQRDSDVLLFVDSFHDMGRAYLALKQDDNAMKSYLQPLQKLRDWDREHPQSEEGRSRLATGYLAMGRILSKDDANGASKALNQGIRILLELVTERTDNETYILQLGEAYGQVAELVALAPENQKAAGAKDALVYQQSAVSYLQILTEKNHSEPKYRQRYAAALTRSAEWLAAITKYKDALTAAKLAQNLVEDLEREVGVASDDQVATRHTQLILQSVLGLIHGELKQSEDSAAAYAKAVEVAQKILTLEPQNEEVKQLLARAQEQVARAGK